MDIKKTIIIIVIIYGALAIINGIFNVGSSPSNDTPAAVVYRPAVQDKKPVVGEVIRKNYLVPGMDFEESVFHVGSVEVAKQKIVKGKIVESSGAIPDGKVKFIDEYQKTYGEEAYRNGKKHGSAETYYQDGRLKSSAQYFLGELVSNKEFYNDGAVRMEQNYEDAIIFSDDPARETGVGKVYFLDGTLKYEWSFTKNNPVNFKKSYNRNGELTQELYYDKDGSLVKR